MVGGTDLLLKTLTLRSFHIVQVTSMHGYGRHGFPVLHCIAQHHLPPLPKGRITRPLMSVEGGNPKPTLNHIPKPLGIAALREEMCHRLSLHAKRAKPTIAATPSLKTILRPNSIADGQPSEELDLWRGPNLPHHLVHIC